MLKILFCGTKIEANSRNSVLNHPQRRKQLEIPFRGTKIEANSAEFHSKAFCGQKHALSYVCGSMNRYFCNSHFFPVIQFHSELRIDSSVNLGMLRKEHFPPRNNGNRSESIPLNFFGLNSVANPTSIETSVNDM
jgi:hypothetical protein